MQNAIAKNPPVIVKAASYLRVSSKQQANDDRWGLFRQQDEVGNYASVKGLAIVKTFKDSITGKSTSREGFDALKTYCIETGVTNVVISSIDRLARETTASYKLLSELIELNLVLHSADFGIIDLSLDESMINFSLRSLFSTLEHRAIGKRIRAAHLGMAKSGIPPSGLKAYGYTMSEGKPAIVPAQAAIVRRIFAYAAEHRALVWIQNTLNCEGVPIAQPSQVKEGNAPVWHRTAIGKMLRNAIYKGEYRWRDYPIKVPAIVSSEVWEAAQRIKRGAPSRTGWVLVGHVRCAVCGLRMGARAIHKPRKDGYYDREMYRCGSTSLPQGACGAPLIDRAWLEAEAEQEVRRVLTSPEVLREIMTASSPPDTRADEALAVLGDEDRRWLEAFRAEAISASELGEYRRDIAARKRALEMTETEVSYPLEEYAKAAMEMPFAELLELSGAVVIASRAEVRVTFE